jgi:hypothetical protein
LDGLAVEDVGILMAILCISWPFVIFCGHLEYSSGQVHSLIEQTIDKFAPKYEYNMSGIFHFRCRRRTAARTWPPFRPSPRWPPNSAETSSEAGLFQEKDIFCVKNFRDVCVIYASRGGRCSTVIPCHTLTIWRSIERLQVKPERCQEKDIFAAKHFCVKTFLRHNIFAAKHFCGKTFLRQNLYASRGGRCSTDDPPATPTLQREATQNRR